MASVALDALCKALAEVEDLQRADHTPVGGTPADPQVSRVIGRASVVLLSSHFERYVYALNEEAADSLNTHDVSSDLIPEALRLQHSQSVIDEIFGTEWDRRGPKLVDFASDEARLWSYGMNGTLDHKRLLTWMKAPTPKNLSRYFQYWGFPDIFSTITRTSHTRNNLWLRIDELVGKRNNIAHGDPTTEATSTEIDQYRGAALTFCRRVDRALGTRVGKLIGHGAPW